MHTACLIPSLFKNTANQKRDRVEQKIVLSSLEFLSRSVPLILAYSNEKTGLLPMLQIFFIPMVVNDVCSFFLLFS